MQVPLEFLLHRPLNSSGAAKIMGRKKVWTPGLYGQVRHAIFDVPVRYYNDVEAGNIERHVIMIDVC